MQVEMKKKAGLAILISHKIDFRVKAIIRDKEGYHIILNEVVQQEGIILINIYALNTRAPKHIEKILEDFKKETDSNVVIVGDFNTPL